MAPEVCPNCGAVVPPRAKACPECGSDDSTGWSDAAKLNNLGLPDEDFDYDRYVAEEFGDKRVKPRGIHWLWWLTALGLIVALAWFFR